MCSMTISHNIIIHKVHNLIIMTDSTTRDYLFMALVINPIVAPYLFAIIGAIGSVIGVEIMQMYLNYCTSHGIYVDPSGGAAYGIYGMILGFIGIYVFLFVLFIIYLICAKK
ncbi:hypothetical protein H012_gp034 [Acanthamoeba polyphaga moumouvirus]|uniref:Uncharacterized protein n=1 Tax=Acanthamoeba polyphaga moumouvirus TaxID=1269028 RepID=L7RCR5_9VIRU|nr:hypothetical protein H012_gp034 [Acanthamoeba polyphaga moumouvirus]AGC02414.1 hypothetical protein Moumou_00899 [Acanthamoeba polyphaga moumouvirus]